MMMISSQEDKHSVHLVSMSSREENIDSKDNVMVSISSPSTGRQAKPDGDVDDAMEYAIRNKTENPKYDKSRDAKLLRKIDFFLMPIICCLYAIQFMDKLTNSLASILGLRTELRMHGNMYSWTGSAFYLGYMVFEFPAVRFLQSFPVSKTLSVFIVLWGVVLCLHSIPNYAGFVALRTILGILESSITPGLVIITSQYYRGANPDAGAKEKSKYKDEIFLRTAWWFASTGFGIIVGSAIAYAIVVHQDSYSIQAWKLIFIVTGVITIFVGLVFLVHVPDKPTKAWFLTEEEKKLVVERIRVNQQGFGNKKFKIYQFKEALLDLRTWLFFLAALSISLPTGGLTNFGSILLAEGFGYSLKKTMLMQMPVGAVNICGCVIFAWLHRFVESRMFWATFGNAVTFAAQCMLAFGKTNQIMFAGYIVQSLGPIAFICLLANISSNVTGHTKKVTVNAILLVGYCVGNLIGPQTFLDSEAPNYKTAKACIVAFGLLNLLLFVLIWLSYLWDNRKKNRAYAEAGEIDMFENYEFADLTDKENPLFRYKI
ncbi:hypothetical protein G9P44_004898 [Scheffersomyces stipitis]|nr:hypothetical protein G9P44_004898 [Scheffersomyces stipitis]